MSFQQKSFRRRRRAPVAKSTFTTYMDEGGMHYRAGHYRKALLCFDRALELQATHKAALVARSQCHLKLGDAASALADAEASFDKKDTYIPGLLQYAEALYNLGQFEKALLAYHRGFRIRRDVDGFRIGVQKCQEAIRTAIGDHSATQIEDLDEILPLIEAMEALKNMKKDYCCVRPSSAENGKRAGAILKKPSKNRERWVAREVLGPMYSDKDYLIKFLNRPDIQSNQGAALQLRANATEALNYLQIREMFWRQQRPMYSRKVGLNFNNNMVRQYEEQERVRQEALRKIKMDAAEGAVLKNLSLIEHALSIGRPKDCQLECERTMRQMKKIGLRLLPRKPEFMCQILHYRGLALVKLKRFDQAAATFQEELNIATDHRMTEVKSRALDHLGRSFALKGSYAEAAEIWETRVSMAKTPLERAYLFHEIGRCYFELNKMDVAKYYGEQALEEALKIEDDIWAMNSRIFLGQIEIKNGSLESAMSQFESAEEYAIKCGNNANASLLREAQQCLKVWMEKNEQKELEDQAAGKSDSQDSIELGGKGSGNALNNSGDDVAN